MDTISFEGSYNPNVQTYNSFTEIQEKINLLDTNTIIFDFTKCQWF